MNTSFFSSQYIASKAGTLLEVLNNMESICEFVAAFWTSEKEQYSSHGNRMVKQGTILLKVMKNAVIKKNIEVWSKAKVRMDNYADAMSVISNKFNFVSRAKPTLVHKFTLNNLELVLHVPKHLNIKAITN